jgi:hypothetical protein
MEEIEREKSGNDCLRRNREYFIVLESEQFLTVGTGK